MPLPLAFDQNEWYLIIALFISYSLVFILPRRFPTTITLLLFLFSIAVARVSDHTLAGPNLDLYDVMDTTKFELFDIFSYLLYAPFAYFFVYVYDKWKIKGLYLLLYLVASSIGGVLIELLSHYFQVFEYKWWEPRYSFTVYFVLQPATLIFYEFINKEGPEGQEPRSSSD